MSPELGPTLLSFSRQIAFGMLYFSTKCFVHRDLAARNILISSDHTTCKVQYGNHDNIYMFYVSIL